MFYFNVNVSVIINDAEMLFRQKYYKLNKSTVEITRKCQKPDKS